jgi:hypothetical protein
VIAVARLALMFGLTIAEAHALLDGVDGPYYLAFLMLHGWGPR